MTFSKLTVTSSAPSEEKNRSWLNDYLRKASLNLIRQSVASVRAKETVAAAPPAEQDTPGPHAPVQHTIGPLAERNTSGLHEVYIYKPQGLPVKDVKLKTDGQRVQPGSKPKKTLYHPLSIELKKLS